jgi:hypothetical protein
MIGTSNGGSDRLSLSSLFFRMIHEKSGEPSHSAQSLFVRGLDFFATPVLFFAAPVLRFTVVLAAAVRRGVRGLPPTRLLARRFTPPSASMFSLRSAAFSSFKLALNSETTLSCPSSSAQAINVPYREIS